MAVLVSVAAAIVALLTMVGVAVGRYVINPVEAVPGPTPTVTGPTPTGGSTTESSGGSTTEGSSGGSTGPSQGTTTEPPPPPPPPPPPEPPPQFPAGSTVCPAEVGNVGGFTQSAAGNNVTSCPFAEQVRQAYGRQPARNTTVDILAHSPVTDITYNLTCVGDRLVTCQGGQNAVVHLL